MSRWLALSALLLAFDAQAQVPLLVEDPMASAASAVFGTPEDPRTIVTLPVAVNARQIADMPTSILVDVPTAPPMSVSVRRFDTGSSTWPIPPGTPDADLAFYWYGYGGGAELSVSAGNGYALARVRAPSDLYIVEGPIAAASLRWVETAFFGVDDIYPPIPPPTVTDLSLHMALVDAPAVLRPGSTGVLLVTVHNAGPDASVGSVLVFDQAPLAGRLRLASHLVAPGTTIGPCAHAAFPVPGLPGMQVLRLYVPPLAAGASYSCPLPVEMFAPNDVVVRARLHIRNLTLLFVDPELANNDAVVRIAGGVTALPPVSIPGGSVPALFVLAAALCLLGMWNAAYARGPSNRRRSSRAGQ